MNSDIENREWINEYMSLKQVNSNNPFTVPEGYFDALSDCIVSQIHLDEVKSDNELGGFAVPENYFDQLTANIQSKVFIEENLDIEQTGFTTPKEYFSTLTEQIQSQVFLENYVDKDKSAFTVPENYFSDLTNQIQSRIFIGEGLDKDDSSFRVPPAYFDTLSGDILEKTVFIANINGKGIIRKLFASTAFKYATAACFAVAIGGGILINELSNPVNEHNNSFLHKQLSNIPVGDIETYLQLNQDAGDTQQTVVTEGVNVDANSLKDALKKDTNSFQ